MDHPTLLTSVKPPSCHILVVEDNLENLRLLQEVLEFRDYTVAAARSGREALHTLMTSPCPPDLVIADFHLSDMTAAEMLHILAQLRQGSLVPFIILSGQTDLPHTHREWMADVPAFLAKPYTIADLHAAIDRVLAGVCSN
jgi:CheY-like chemotaxis protein